MERFDQTTQRVKSDELYEELIRGQKLANYQWDKGRTSAHVQHAVATETPRGMRMRKDKTTMKIDFAVADSMAVYGVEMHRSRIKDYWAELQSDVVDDLLGTNQPTEDPWERIYKV